MKLSRKRGLKKRRNKKLSRKRRVQKGGFIGTFYSLAMMPLKIAGNIMSNAFTGVKSLVDKNNAPQQQAANNNVQAQNNLNTPAPAQMNNVAAMNNSVMIDSNTKSIIESDNNNITYHMDYKPELKCPECRCNIKDYTHIYL